MLFLFLREDVESELVAGIEAEGVRSHRLGCTGVPDVDQQLKQLVDATPCMRTSDRRGGRRLGPTPAEEWATKEGQGCCCGAPAMSDEEKNFLSVLPLLYPAMYRKVNALGFHSKCQAQKSGVA